MNKTSTEWVPSVNMNPAARLPSTWRTTATKRLTSQKINEYRRAGKYGPDEKRKAIYEFEQKHGIRVCVKCGAKGHFTIKHWDWLEKSGAYCATCIAMLRTERDKDKNDRKAWRERIKEEYV